MAERGHGLRRRLTSFALLTLVLSVVQTARSHEPRTRHRRSWTEGEAGAVPHRCRPSSHAPNVLWSPPSTWSDLEADDPGPRIAIDHVAGTHTWMRDLRAGPERELALPSRRVRVEGTLGTGDRSRVRAERDTRSVDHVHRSRPDGSDLSMGRDRGPARLDDPRASGRFNPASVVTARGDPSLARSRARDGADRRDARSSVDRPTAIGSTTPQVVRRRSAGDAARPAIQQPGGRVPGRDAPARSSDASRSPGRCIERRPWRAGSSGTSRISTRTWSCPRWASDGARSSTGASATSATRTSGRANGGSSRRPPPAFGGQPGPGFDCSGLSWWALRADDGTYWEISPPRPHEGWALPQRTSAEMARLTKVKLRYADLLPGDLMFYDGDVDGDRRSRRRLRRQRLVPRLVEQRRRRHPDVGGDRLVPATLRARTARPSEARALDDPVRVDRALQDRPLRLGERSAASRLPDPSPRSPTPPRRRVSRPPRARAPGPDARGPEAGDAASHDHLAVALLQLAPEIDRHPRDHEVPGLRTEEGLDETIARLLEVVQEDRVVDVTVRVDVSPPDRDPDLCRHGRHGTAKRSPGAPAEGPARLRRAGPPMERVSCPRSPCRRRRAWRERLPSSRASRRPRPPWSGTAPRCWRRSAAPSGSPSRGRRRRT